MRTLFAISAFAISAAICVAPALAVDENNVTLGVTAAEAPLGLHGVDPVAFITIGNRIDGRAEHAAVHDGVAYYFSTSDNLRKFKRDPQAYIPQNGGFCTFGVSVGKKFDGDPQFADVRDGKLYVFLNEDIYNAYQKDKAGTIAKAEAQWGRIIHVPVGDL
jgi:YHS domain-containing protein